MMQVEAIYEHGVLRPLKPLPLAESQRVSVTISDPASGERITDLEFLDTVRAEAEALGYVPSLEDVQRAMSKIPGSLTADFMNEREERGF